MKLYYQKNKEKLKARQKTYRITHLELFRESNKRHYWKNIDKSRAKNKEKKVQALLHYTRVFDSNATAPYCHNPFSLHLSNDPFSLDLDCLSIDHINGDGYKRRTIERKHGGTDFYRWLIKNNFPEGFQVLCMNCQFKKKNANRELRKGGS